MGNVAEIDAVGDKAGMDGSSSFSLRGSWHDVKNAIRNSAEKASTSLYLDLMGTVDEIIL